MVGKPVSVSVVDSAGATWTLAVPADALDSIARITLTPYASVSPQPGAPHVSSGVKLDPDGLRFADPPVLTVTPPAGHARPTLLSARGDGSGLGYAEGRTAESMLVPHFSAAVADWDPVDLASVRADLADAELTATTYIGKAVNPVSTALPHEPLSPCRTSQELSSPSQLADAALEADYLEPESDMIQRLLGDDHVLAENGVDVGSEPTDLAARLAGRVQDRAIADIRTQERLPDHGEDFFRPLSRILLEVTRQLGLLGVSYRNEISPELAGWASELADDQVDKLKRHDYAAFQKGLMLDREYELLGGNGDAIIAKLIKLLRFNVHFTFTITGSANETAEISGTVQPNADGSLLSDPSGSGRYTGGSVLVPTAGTAGKATPDGWTAAVTSSGPYTCNSTMALNADPWGKDAESWQIKGYNIPVTVGGIGTLLKACMGTFADAIQENEVFTGFPGLNFDLHNNDATAVDGEKTTACGGSGGSYQLVVHARADHVV